MFHKRPGEERRSCASFPIKSKQSRWGEEKKKKSKASLRGTPEEGKRIADPRKPEAPASRRESRGRSPQGKEVWSRSQGELPREEGNKDSDGRREDYQAERGVGLPGQCPGQMSLRAGGGKGPGAGNLASGGAAAGFSSSGPQQLNSARPVVPAWSPGSLRVGSGTAEPSSRRRLYLRRRLEALQPELRPPPAPRPERDEARPAPSPLGFLFPAGACRRGFLRRGPHPSAPPSASQRLALDAAIFAQACER